MSMSGLIHFLGTFDELPTSAGVGDVCVYNNDIYIYTNSSWNTLGIKIDVEKEISKVFNGTYLLFDNM